MAVINGTDGSDNLVGTNLADTIDGRLGADTLTGGRGNDTLIGGAGFGVYDTAVYAGNRQDYEIVTGSQTSVRDLNSANGDEGTDTLSGIEYVRFADMTISLGIDPNNPPKLGEPHMVDQTWSDGLPASYKIPETAFFDLDGNDQLTMTATLSSGLSLPTWLSFDPVTETFSGTPPVDQVGTTLEIKVTASDGTYSVSDNFLINVTPAPGPDVIGTDAAETLEGTFRGEVMDARQGDDILRGSLGADSLYGDAGTDEADYSLSPEGINVDLTSWSNLGVGGHAEGDQWSSIENVRGSAFHDTIIGNYVANVLDGGAGNDRLDGGAGADAMAGGADNDTYVVDDVGDAVTELGGAGTDEVETNLGVGSTQAQRTANMYQLGANVENLTGTAINQGLQGNSLNNVITSGAGTDYVDTTDGGSDTVNAGDGRDVIYYGGALDSGDANNGGDEGGDARGDLLVIQGNYNITLGADDLVDIEKFRVLKGSNTAFGYEDGGLFNYNIVTVDQNVAAGGRLVVQGGSLQLGEHLIFNGTAETNGSFQLFGGRDSDTLIGGAGDDHILGRAGDDELTGNGGADRLRGGLGGDTMDGGTGGDIFVYAAQGGDEPYAVAALESTSLNYDTITGFNYAEDRIDLPQTVASLGQVLTGSLSDASFDADVAAAVNGALNPNAAVLFAVTGGTHNGETFLVVDADNNGSYQANLDFVIELQMPTGAVPTGTEIFV